MAYTTTQIKTEVRALLGEEDTTGYYGDVFLLKQINISIKSRIIPDLFAVSKYALLEGLYTLDTAKTLVEVTGKGYWDYDFSAALAYPLSVKAWVKAGSIYLGGINIDISEVWKYKDDAYAYFRPNFPFAIVGKKIRCYEINDEFGANPAPTLDMEYIKFPVYTTGQAVALSDHVVEALLIPILCYEVIRREPEMPKAKAEAFKLDYTEAIRVIAETYRLSSGPEPLPVEKYGGLKK